MLKTKSGKSMGVFKSTLLAILVLVAITVLIITMLIVFGSVKEDSSDYDTTEGSAPYQSLVPNLAWKKTFTMYVPYEDLEFYRQDVSKMERNQVNISFINSIDSLSKKGVVSVNEYLKAQDAYYDIKDQNAKIELLHLIKNPT